MTKTCSFIFLIALAVVASVHPGEAAWKKRGWYMKKPGTQCTMRTVTSTTAGGRTIVQKIRVCGSSLPTVKLFETTATL